MYDTIIIGSGLGGLMTALILAKEGRKVAIIEKNKQFGGNLQSFLRDEVLFDTGVHYVGSLGEGQTLHNYFSYAGITSALDLEAMPKDGMTIFALLMSLPATLTHRGMTILSLSYYPISQKKKSLWSAMSPKYKKYATAFPSIVFVWKEAMMRPYSVFP